MATKARIINMGGYDIYCNSLSLGNTRSSLNYSNAPISGGIVSSSTSLNGTVTTTATTSAQEYGSGPHHTTVLTMTNFSLGNLADNAALGIGAKFYTLPAGEFQITRATIYGGLTAAVSVTAQTPEVAIGTVVASGVISATTTTMENVIDGGSGGSLGDASNTAPDLVGGIFRKSNLTTVAPIIKASAGLSHDLFLNAAATWADITTVAPVLFTGIITLNWVKLN